MFRRFFTVLELYRATLLVSVLSLITLSTPDQVIEVYRVIAEIEAFPWFAFVSATLLSASLFVQNLAISVFSNNVRTKPAQQNTGFWLYTLEVVISILPVIGMLIGLTRASIDFEATNRGGIIEMAIACIAVLVAIAISMIIFRIIKLRERLSKVFQRVFGDNGVLITTLFILLSVVFTILVDSRFHSAIGPISIWCLFGIVLSTSLTVYTIHYDNRGIPIASTLVLTSILWTMTGINNNHRVQLLESRTDADRIETAFKNWLSSRSDLNEFIDSGTPYPVYIVAAEGGGLYAAYHTAATLSHIDDNCPRFTHHTFALSSVSGGSLGAAFFTSAKQIQTNQAPQHHCVETPQNSGTLQDESRQYFENDFFSPLLASSLFPDFFQRFIPFSIEPFDRARALERSFETAWSDVYGSRVTNAFENSFRNHWTPNHNSPALILNTTEANLGKREFIAPFLIESRYAPQSLQFLGAKTDIKLSVAVGMSARFPWITPAARVSNKKERFDFVDGGYADNSGTATARDVMKHLVAKLSSKSNGCMNSKELDTELSQVFFICLPLGLDHEERDRMVAVPIEFKLLVIRANKLAKKKPSNNEVLIPIYALLSSQQVNSSESRSTAKEQFCPHCQDTEFNVNDAILAKSLDLDTMNLPLGWMLSQKSLQKIEDTFKQSNDAGLSQCQLKTQEKADRIISQQNNCYYYMIWTQLGETENENS